MDPDEASKSGSGAKSPLEGAPEESCSNPVAASDNSKECTSESPHMDPKNLHYEGDVCIYTDPDTKYQYQWDNSTQQWTPKGQQLKEGDASKDVKPPGGKSWFNYLFFHKYIIVEILLHCFLYFRSEL